MGHSIENSLAETAFIPVSAATLIPETALATSLYLPKDDEGAMQLYRGPNVPFEKADLSRLASRGHTKLFVRADEHADYQKYLRDNLETVIEDESQSVEQRFASMNEVVRDVLATSFATRQTNEMVETCQGLAKTTVELICRDDVVESDLMGMMHHDYHTFTHSANVSYYCVLLGKELQISPEDGLNEIAIAALLHDLGKLDIPDKVLCKPGRLSDAEFDIIRRHPRTGFHRLCHREDLSFGQLMMVYQHHERLDGKGYPVGTTAEEIHPWARICTVADVFEALTSNRPYRVGMSSDQAFEIMDRDRGLAFDEELLKCWKTTIQHK